MKKMKSRVAFFSSCIVLLCCLNALSQTGEKKKIRLLHADIGSSQEINGRQIRKLSGNVHIQSDSIDIFCDTLWYFDDTETYKLLNNVRINDGRRTLYSDEVLYLEVLEEARCNNSFKIKEKDRILEAQRGNYNYKDKILEAEKEVIFTERNREITCDYLKYLEEKGKVFLSGTIKFKDHKERILGKGEEGNYNVKDNFGFLTGNPVVIIEDTTTGDSLFISGKQIEYNEKDTATFTVRDSVRITKDDLKAESTLAEYFENDDFIILKNKPVVYYREDRLYADSIKFFLHGRTIYKVESIGNAIVYSRADTTGQSELESELEGKYIYLHFTDGLIDSLISLKNAESLYYIFTNGILQGANKTSGEKITFFFDEGILENIVVENGIIGKFFPPEQISKVKEDDRKTEDSGTGKTLRQKDSSK